MVGYPTAYVKSELIDMLESNSNVPAITEEKVDRLLGLASQRADGRGNQNALDSNQTDCIIATDWNGFAEGEFGYDSNDNLNQFAMGVLDMEASVGKDATLFTDTYIIQDGWLATGDGRRLEAEQYVDDDYDGATTGDMWVPRGAQDYIAIIKLSDELVLESPSAADAM